jgi:DNA-binding transcriptional LysR family regulator
MNKFEELEAFVAVVDKKGFSAASDRSGVAKSVLSRRVRDLEKRLGVQLMQRTTRRLSLTDSGTIFYQRAVGLLSDLRDAEQLISDSQCELSGKIKLAAPLGLGTGRLAEPIAEFMVQNPEVEILVDLNDRQVDLIEERIDLAIRVYNLPDSSLIARKLADVNFAICASPTYLRDSAPLNSPEDLEGREMMIYSNTLASRQWTFEVDGKRVSPRIKSRASANNGEFLALMASKGLGITMGPLFYLQKYIERGELIPILSDWVQDSIGMYAVYPPGKLVSRRVKMLSDFLHRHFQDQTL